jgi:hypothetical protein
MHFWTTQIMFARSNNQINSYIREIPKVTNTVEPTKCEKAFGTNGKKQPSTRYSSADQESHRGSERPKDDGETKTILGFIGAGLKTLTLQSSLLR